MGPTRGAHRSVGEGAGTGLRWECGRGEACGVGRGGLRGERGGGWAKGEGREGSRPKEKKKLLFFL